MTKRAAIGPSIDAACLAIAQASPSAGRKATRSPPENSIRPASSSSISATRTSRADASAARARSSSVIGEGPSRATMRSRTPSSDRRDVGEFVAWSRSSGAAAPRPPRIDSSACVSPERLALAAALRERREQIVRAHRRERRQHVVDRVQIVAPCFRRSLVPSARGSSGEPGTANTWRFCSSANRAVMSDPEPRAASTTTVAEREAGDDAIAARKVASARLPFDRHLGHDRAVFDHALDQRRPPRSDRVSRGLRRARRPRRSRGSPRARAGRCRARDPRRRHSPPRPSPRASRSAKVSPAAEALREPTIATAGCCSASWPAAAGEDRRRRIDLAQERRIVRLRRSRRSARRACGRPSSSRSISSTVATRTGRSRAAAAGELRQRLERRPRGAARTSMSARKVRGPTFSERISRSQSNS